MFKARIDANTLREYLELATAVIDDGILKITENGIKLKAVDPSNVAMVSLELSSDAFSEFQLNAEESTEPEEEIMEKQVGLDFEKLLSIFAIGGGDEIELKLDNEKQKLLAKMGNLDYSISLLDLASLRKEPRVPELDYEAQVVIETGEFRRTLRAMERISDYVMLGVTEDMFYMETYGETDKLRMELLKEQLISFKPKNAKTLFSTEYIVAMSKGMSHAKNVTLNLGKDYPLQMDAEIAEGKGKVSYLLAPRIEE